MPSAPEQWAALSLDSLGPFMPSAFTSCCPFPGPVVPASAAQPDWTRAALSILPGDSVMAREESGKQVVRFRL